MKKFLIYICSVIFLLAPLSVLSQDKDNDDDHKDLMDEGHEDVVKLTQAEIDEFEIVISTAASGLLRLSVTVPGEVTVNFDKQAHVAPRFPGIVTKVLKHLGDNVKKGDVLAIIESNEGLVAYEIKSLLDGTIIDKHITIGEVLHNESPAFLIADLKTVWINLSIYQMHLPIVKEGQEVIVSSSGQEFSDTKGVISYLSPIVDEHTRTASARVVLDNKNGNLRPGLFVEGNIITSEEIVDVLVPISSIQQFEGHKVVFVETPNGFVPVPVTLGRSDLISVEIISGLNADDKFVSKGAFTLRSELEKSSLSSGHHH